MDSFFFRVEHDLLRSESFKTLGGSAIKVYLTIGLYSDFGTGWAFPSIRTIARQAGLSRQTVLTAIEELVKAGLMAIQKAPGRANAYRIMRQAPQRGSTKNPSEKQKPVPQSGPKSLVNRPPAVLESLEVSPPGVLESGTVLFQADDLLGQPVRPERETSTREERQHDDSDPWQPVSDHG